MLGRGRSSNSLTRKPEAFPLYNRKLKQENWEEDCISIKKYRSPSQLARKRSQTIPLLKINNYGTQLTPAQVTRSQQREYNVYLRRSAPGSDFTFNKQVVNGHTGKLREVVQRSVQRNVGFCLTAANWHSARLRQNPHLVEQKLISCENYAGNGLQVMGEEVKLSIERSQRRSISNFDYRELKW